jgi:hypothetical protein
MGLDWLFVYIVLIIITIVWDLNIDYFLELHFHTDLLKVPVPADKQQFSGND